VGVKKTMLKALELHSWYISCYSVGQDALRQSGFVHVFPASQPKIKKSFAIDKVKDEERVKGTTGKGDYMVIRNNLKV
jgi:hypothetical protein